MNTRINNFDIIRFFMAWAVIYSHAFVLTGSERRDICYNATKGQIDCGHLAVSVFFVLSGYLICMSYVRSSSNIHYFISRILRIFPALTVVVILTTFIVGPIFTSLSLEEYFTTPLTYAYLLNIFLLHVDKLPGVFEENTYSSAINGSLWTLICEFALYVYIFFLGVTKTLKKEIVILLFITAFIFHFGFESSLILEKISELFLYFNIGMLIYFYFDRIKFTHKIALGTLLILVMSIFTNYFLIVYLFAMPYLLFYISVGPVKKFPNFAKRGDFSYGMYIYAFLIQQILVQVTNNQISTFMNIVLSTILALGCAFLSWHIIEKRSIKFGKEMKIKNFINKKGVK